MTKVSARRIRWWDKRLLIRPSASPARTRGKIRCYTLQDIVCISVVKKLRERGVGLKKIKEAVDRVSVTGVHHPLAKLRVACLAHTMVVKKDGKYIDPISGQLVIEQALEEIRPHVEKRRLAPAERAVRNAQRYYEQKMAVF